MIADEILRSRGIAPVLLCAIYARKSTEQHVSDEMKSIQRQIDHAKAYAEQNGWIVDPGSIFVDDGVSGADFKSRPGFLRLMNALAPKPKFHVLIIADESRLGRESIQTSTAMMELVRAGVRIFCYLSNKEIRLDSPEQKAMVAIVNVASEFQRAKTQQQVSDAMMKLAKAGYVTGCEPFGYENVKQNGPKGLYSHTTRRIVDEEAEIVRYVFERSAAGAGKARICRELNERGVKPARSKHGKWNCTTIWGMLHRELYRGVIVYNKTTKSSSWEARNLRKNDASHWIRIDAPELRIIDEPLWQRVHERLARLTSEHAQRSKRYGRGGRRQDGESRYMLSRLARCKRCGGPICVISRPASYAAGADPTLRVFLYGCNNFHRRGKTICANNHTVSVPTMDAAVLDAICRQVLAPQTVADIAARVVAKLLQKQSAKDTAKQQKQLERLQRERSNMASAIRKLGPLPELLTELHDTEKQAATIEAQIRLSEMAPFSPAAVRTLADKEAKQWRQTLKSGGIREQRALLRQTLTGPIWLEPGPAIEGRKDGKSFRFEGQLSVAPLFSANVSGLATDAASLMGLGDCWKPVFTGLAA